MVEKEKYILIKEIDGVATISWALRDPEEKMLDFFHKEIGCQTITMTEIADGVDIVSDDEALLKSGDIVLYKFVVDGREFDIPGNCIIAGVNEVGETLPVTEELFSWFKNNVELYGRKGTVG